MASFGARGEQKQGEWQAEEEGEAGSTVSKDPNVALEARTLGSWPGLKVVT